MFEIIALLILGAAVPVLVVVMVQSLTRFEAQRFEDYAGQTPRLDLRQQLCGALECEGVIYGPGGGVVSRFTAEMEGRWTGDSCVLEEHFLFDSGAKLRRAWHVRVEGDTEFAVDAEDTPGGGRGRNVGPAAELRYALRLPSEGGGHVVQVTDWMYLCADGRIVNRSKFRKFGFPVAELVATIRRKGPA